MDEELLAIGEVARCFGLRVSALRFYEERGLLRPALRRSSRRYYGRAELRRLALIQMWQSVGLMTLDEIGTVIAGPAPDRRSWRDVLRARIAVLDEQARRIPAARAHLEHALTCPSDDPVAECSVLARQLDEQVAQLLEKRPPLLPGMPTAGSAGDCPVAAKPEA
jgi:MerR family copper efflux transcriptional regulator